MTVSTSLYELILNLLRDPEALAAFREDPDAYLAACGDFSSDDVHDALVLLQDQDQDADFSRDHNGANTVHVAPPADPPDPEPGESDTEAAVRYLDTYVTNNYIDDSDTIVDNSVNQQIDTDGGDFDQDIDIDSTVASGDGAVAAGDDIDGSTITTGDDNQVGDGNVRGDGNVVGDGNEIVDGDGNTVAFGGGDANSAVFDDVTVDGGGAIAVGGSATGGYEADGSFNHTTNETTTTTDIDDSFNTDNDTATSTDTSTSVESSTDSHDDTEVHDHSDNDAVLG